MNADEFLTALQALPSAFKCPECRADIRRPKCVVELGSQCPRHAIVTQLRVERAREAAAVEAMLECDGYGCGNHTAEGEQDWTPHSTCEQCAYLMRAAYLAARRGT